MKVTEAGGFIDSGGASNLLGGCRVESFLRKRLNGSLNDLSSAVGT
jgi:hypothetical protein